MADTFLQMVRDMAADLSVAGGVGGVSSVSVTTGIVWDLARWIRDADTYIQSLYLDWTFLWTEASVTLSASSDVVPQPTAADLNYMRKGTLVIRQGTATAHQPEFMEWGKFYELYEINAKNSSDYPSHYSIKPDGVIVLSHNMVTADSAVYKYYKTPTRMSQDSSVSVIMAFDDYAAEIGRKCILARAKIDYATREDAPEVMASAASEYEDTLSKLEARYHAQNVAHILGNADGELGDIVAS